MSSVSSIPKVTVMIPTYRQAGVVGRAVDSALAQDYPELEVVVADDASPDGTQAALHGLNDPRLRYYRNPVNIGRVANYRRTLNERASGEWVVNLDGDDYFTDPGFVSAAINSVIADDKVVIVAARARVEGPGTAFVTAFPRNCVMDGIQVALCAANSDYHFVHLASLYRRTLALKLDFYRDDVISSDWESLYRLACHGKVAFIDRVVGVWCVDASGASQTREWTSMARNTRIWSSICEELRNVGVTQQEAQRAMDLAAANAGRVHATMLARAGSPRGLLRYVRAMEGVSWRVRARVLLDPKIVALLLAATMTNAFHADG